MDNVLNNRSDCDMIWGMEAYWDRVIRLRVERGLSREELARRAELTVSYIYRIEKGQVDTPSYETARRLADALNVGVVALMEGERGSVVSPVVDRIAHLITMMVPVERLLILEKHIRVWISLAFHQQELLTDIGTLMRRDDPHGVHMGGHESEDEEKPVNLHDGTRERSGPTRRPR